MDEATRFKIYIHIDCVLFVT